jgi:hypothetical protein
MQAWLRLSISLTKMLGDELQASVLYRSEYHPYFKTNVKLFPLIEFLVQLLQHLPEPRAHLVRHYGLYSSRSRGMWMRKPYLVRLAPGGWKQQHSQHCALHVGEASRTALSSPSPPGGAAQPGHECWPRSARSTPFAAAAAVHR